MEKVIAIAVDYFKSYYNSFAGLNAEQEQNFQIKYDHSVRVADLCLQIAVKLHLTEEEQHLARLAGLLHDIGRFRQLTEFNTFNDALSVDHADYSVQVVRDNHFFDGISEPDREKLFLAIQYHNKRELPKDLPDSDLLYAKILRDADKLDILQVITDYYTTPKVTPNHTLTWEMPKGAAVSPEVVRQAMAGKLVSKSDVINQMDIKIMQLTWVYDINFKPTFDLMMRKRFMEKIYSTLPKNDTVIGIYRKVKVFAENKLLA